jgi:hypothetical protein
LIAHHHLHRVFTHGQAQARNAQAVGQQLPRAQIGLINNRAAH